MTTTTDFDDIAGEVFFENYVGAFDPRDVSPAAPAPAPTVVSATISRESAVHAYLIASDGRTWDVYGDSWEEMRADAATIAKVEGLSIDSFCSSIPGSSIRSVYAPTVCDMVAEAGLIAARGDAVGLRAYLSGLATDDAAAVEFAAESDWEGLAFDTWCASLDRGPTFAARVAARRGADLASAHAPADIDGNPIVDIWYRDGSIASAMPARSMAWTVDCGISRWAYAAPDVACDAYRAPHRLMIDSGRAYLLPRAD